MVNPATLQITIDSVQGIIAIIAPIVIIGIAWGTIRSNVSSIERILNEEIKPDLKNVRERFASVETKVDVLWKDQYAPAESPRQLNNRGNQILIESGINKIVDAHKDILAQEIKQISPDSPYDAEKLIMDFMATEFLKRYPGIEPQIKDGAFRTGVDENVVLFIGGIYLRNIIFPLLGFNLTDLDQKTASS